MSTRRPRYRYIAFTIAGPRAFTRDEVMEAMRAGPDQPWLVEFRENRGLARCTNLQKDATIRALVRIETIAGEAVRVSTLGTSGTIRRAKEKYL